MSLAIETTWYKGNIPYWKITEIEFTNVISGESNESWDASANQDGSIICYRNNTKLNIVCDTITEIGEKTFFKFLSLQKVTGLNNVTVIGAYAFCYTPNIKSIDLIPSKLISIGDSAFRMSSTEDVLDLSNVPLDIIGDKATRNKRWTNAGLEAIRNINFPKNIYLNVPNPDSQLRYSDVQYGTKNGEPCTVAESGCSSLVCYHIWNALYADTDRQYNNWFDWYNDRVNKDGNYASSNEFDGNILSRLVSTLGWTVTEESFVIDVEQLQSVLNRLQKGLPTYAGIPSVNFLTASHAIAIVGCDINTHKLAIVDSSVLESNGVVSWIAFEDIFAEGVSESNKDNIRLFDFNFPTIAPNCTWFTQGNTDIKRANITQIDIVDSYIVTGNEAASWDASDEKNGRVMCYLNGTTLTVAGNGRGKIFANEDSSWVFSDSAKNDYFSMLETINGGNIFDTRNATTFERMFQYASALKSVDTSNWKTNNVITMKTMFQFANSINNLNVSSWDTSNVEDMTGMFNNCKSLTKLDVSNWNTSKVKFMNLMFQICIALESLDLSKWDVSNVTTMSKMFSSTDTHGKMKLTSIGDTTYWNPISCTNMDAMFQNCSSIHTLYADNWNITAVTSMKAMFNFCSALKNLNIDNWNPLACNDMSYLFNHCYALKNLNIDNWNTNSCENMSFIFSNCYNLEELNLSEWDTTNVTNMENMFINTQCLKKITLGKKFDFKNTVLPIPSSEYINGADGNWYTRHRVAYAPAEIPSNTAETYYASVSLVNNIDYMIKNGTLLDIADVLRVNTSNNTTYTPKQMAITISSLIDGLNAKIEYYEAINSNNMVYYSTMSKAVTDVNNDAIGENADSTKDTAVAGVYTDKNGGKNVVLLKDHTESSNIKPTVDMTINLGGHVLSSNVAPCIDIISGSVIVDGKLRGSAININLPSSAAVVIRTMSNGSVMVNGGSYTCESGNSMACVLLNQGTATARSCNMAAVSPDKYAYTIQNGGGAVLNISNCDVKGDSENGITESLLNKGTADVRNCNFTAVSKNGFAYTVYNDNGTLNISKCDVTGYADYHWNDGYTSLSVGVTNTNGATLTVDDCYVMGTHSGVHNIGGTLNVNGGTYEGYGHGGFYFAASNTDSSVRNAVIRDCDMPDGYTETAGRNGAGFYISGTDAVNQSVYMDNCDITGEIATQTIAIASSYGAQNNTLYISNSSIRNRNGGVGRIRIDDDTHKVYIGRGNNFTADDTNRPEAVVVTDEVYVQVA